MFQQTAVVLLYVSLEAILTSSFPDYDWKGKTETHPSKSLSSSHDSSTHSLRTNKAVNYSPHALSSYKSSSSLPLKYGYKYASEYDSYNSYSLPANFEISVDLDRHNLEIPFDPDLDLDFDPDLDLDLSELDFIQLKYGLYGLNHYSLRYPHFNDYRFRKRYRLRRRPHFRAHHRYFPRYWKHDLDFWGLDSYGLGFDYDKYLYTSSLSFPSIF